MRRATNLFERIPEYDNLRLAFHKAALGRRSQVAVRQFAAQLDLRIATLSSQLLAGTLPIGRFQQFLIRDPKERVIQGFRGAIGVGLPIGSLTSQHFANLYLGGFDRIVKETLRIRGYVRYMDDMVLWHSDRDLLRDAQDRCYEFAQSQLGLEFKPSFPRRSSAGLSFLGCQVFPTHVELNQRSKRRYRRRVRVLERAERLGLLSELELQQRLTSLTAFARAAGARSWRFRQRVLQERVVNDP